MRPDAISDLESSGMNYIAPVGLPPKTGLYDPDYEKDSCGVGFICDIQGRPSRQIIEDAQEMNCCMEHRGGVGYEKTTGDGAGMLIGLPDKFLRKAAQRDLGITLPAQGAYGVGNVLLPTDEGERDYCRKVLEEEIAASGQVLLGWRTLPVHPDGAGIGNAARAAMPYFAQLFIGAAD
jgi:glutamate synthase (NADPH/NADH) large chain